MLVVTVPQIPGYRIEAVLGEVVGVALAQAGSMNDSSSALIHRGRELATHEMWQQTTARGGNAVVGFSLQLEREDRSFHVVAVGTAVSVVPLGADEDGATPQSIEDEKQRASAGPQDSRQSGPPAGQGPRPQPSAIPPPAGPPPGPYGQPSPGFGPTFPPPQGPPVRPAPPGYGQPPAWGR